MFLLYMHHAIHEYYHASWYRAWMGFSDFYPGESHWLVPGTDPEDPFYAEDWL